mmetsp:Transcript_37042/g.37698  ORF Transcript_37042/g.37698 Transcript_37042/m.37698 type:complete len:236 (+) Transcript_37042:99-806(+)|eukprot:CAMPEP_0182422090 /NCGR_PEP_ID=MMETSP1167-20130531/7684_1 /TAXON_ID=2988 /ORGANISM="Mallomonas Sp, Strain CCMP3275" /LENGTH=235 /DNA_ID=CAMNT_0024599839 /DNA_START=95 /DNA_END=802 /DNA_ORIENTATION=-
MNTSILCKALIFASLLVCYSEAGIFSKTKSHASASKIEESDRIILPKLLPVQDTSYIIAVGIDDNDDCDQMEPVVQRLEEDLDTTVRRINVSRRREFMAALTVMGHDECGRFPFYYNRRTGQAICGATTYANLLKLGTGSVNHLFNDAPENIQSMESQGYTSRQTGAAQYLKEKNWSLFGKKDDKNDKENKKSSSKSKRRLIGKKEEAVPSSQMTATERTAARRAAREKKQKSNI